MGGNVKLAAIVGGRPNLMKMSPILRAFDKHNASMHEPRFDYKLIHTGTANDSRLNDTSWKDVQMPIPDVHLGVGPSTQGDQSARIMLALEKILAAGNTDGVLVVGDGDAALAGALIAAKRRVPIFHVEAGLRAGNMQSPEEINRVIIDRLATRLYTPSPDADVNLAREGIKSTAVACVGNVMIDNLYSNLERSRTSDVLERLGLVGATAVLATPGVAVAESTRYVVVSLRRDDLMHDRDAMWKMLKTINGISRMVPVVLPAAAALRKQLEDWELDEYFVDLTARLEGSSGASPVLPAGVYLVPPVPYLDFLRLLSGAALVITDSGGIQEETTGMGIGCLTLRSTTERPVTVSEGTNTLVGRDFDRLRMEAQTALSGHGKKGRRPKLWDGRAADRIVVNLTEFYSGGR